MGILNWPWVYWNSSPACFTVIMYIYKKEHPFAWMVHFSLFLISFMQGSVFFLHCRLDRNVFLSLFECMTDAGCQEQVQLPDLAGTDDYTKGQMTTQQSLELSYDMLCQKGRKLGIYMQSKISKHWFSLCRITFLSVLQKNLPSHLINSKILCHF